MLLNNETKPNYHGQLTPIGHSQTQILELEKKTRPKSKQSPQLRQGPRSIFAIFNLQKKIKTLKT